MAASMTVTKRFIAGATCPACQALDRVVLYTESGRRWRECVSCGYRDEMLVSAPQGDARRPEGGPGSHETKATVDAIRLVDLD